MAKIYCFWTKILLADLPKDDDYLQMKAMEVAGLGRIEFDYESDSEVFVWNNEAS